MKTDTNVSGSCSMSNDNWEIRLYDDGSMNIITGGSMDLVASDNCISVRAKDVEKIYQAFKDHMGE